MKESFIQPQPLNLATIFPKHWGKFLEKEKLEKIQLDEQASKNVIVDKINEAATAAVEFSSKQVEAA